MTAINDVTKLDVFENVGVITLNSPPVNALSANVREGLDSGMKIAIENNDIEAIVIFCEGRTFIAGADISEFGKEPKGPSLFEVQDVMENSPKPIIAAIHGTALGGGLEVALTCHYRIAVKSAKCGLPEVNLGLLPGAGGTQRLPRLVGVEQALKMVTSGLHLPAEQCLKYGLIDRLVDDSELLNDSVSFAKEIISENRPLKKVRDINEKVEAAKGNDEIFKNILTFNLKPGTSFNRSKIESTQEGIKFILGEKGYAFPDINYNASFNDSTLTFSIIVLIDERQSSS